MPVQSKYTSKSHSVYLTYFSHAFKKDEKQLFMDIVACIEQKN